MLTLLRRTLPAALAAGLLTVPTVRAEDPKKDEPKEGLSAIEAIEMAHKLAVFGRSTKTPEALATAALVLAKASIDADDLPTDKQDGAEAVKYDQAGEAKVLLEEAKKLDPKSKAVEEIAATVAEELKEGKRGATTGAKSITVNLGAGKTYQLLRMFKTAQTGVFAVTVKDPVAVGVFHKQPKWIAVSVTNPIGKPLSETEGATIAKPHQDWTYVRLDWHATKQEQAVCRVTNLTAKPIRVVISNN